MKWIYTLKLVNNKFYVGYTSNLQNRMCQHFNNEGAKWTQLYRPIEIIHVERERHRWHEDFNTLRNMRLYGENNVRGGRWCQLKELSYTPKHLFDIDPFLSLEENIKDIGKISHDWKERSLKNED